MPVYEGDNTVMAQQTVGFIQKTFLAIAKGKPARDLFSYLNEIEALCSLKKSAETVDQFLDLNHLEQALSIRAAFSVRDVMQKLKTTKAKRVTAVNDLFA